MGYGKTESVRPIRKPCDLWESGSFHQRVENHDACGRADISGRDQDMRRKLEEEERRTTHLTGEAQRAQRLSRGGRLWVDVDEPAWSKERFHTTRHVSQPHGSFACICSAPQWNPSASFAEFLVTNWVAYNCQRKRSRLPVELAAPHGWRSPAARVGRDVLQPCTAPWRDLGVCI